MSDVLLSVSRVVPRLKAEYDEKIKQAVVDELAAFDGNLARASESLGIRRTTLTMYLNKYRDVYDYAKKLREELRKKKGLV